MSLVLTPFGVPWPNFFVQAATGGLAGLYSLQVDQALAASGDKLAFIGQLYIEGEAASKTIDTTLSSSIGFRIAGTPTFANAGSTAFDIGIQGVATGVTPPAQPDGTFTVKKRMVQGVDTFTANAWNEKKPDSGSATLSHGQLIAVVFDFNTRAGADSVRIALGNGATSGTVFPTTNHFTAAAWGGASKGATPNIVLTFSDGTLGFIYGAIPVSTGAAQVWASGGADEKGLIFQVPWDCAISGLFTAMRTVDATSDFNLSLYSTPLGTPSSIASVVVDAAQTGMPATDRQCTFPVAAVNLTANTDYCIAVKATGAGNIRQTTFTLGNAAHRKCLSGGTSLFGVSRSAGGGAFGSADGTLMWNMGVIISQLNASAGSPGYSRGRTVYA